MLNLVRRLTDIQLTDIFVWRFDISGYPTPVGNL
jgi:hypothetical protein